MKLFQRPLEFQPETQHQHSSYQNKSSVPVPPPPDCSFTFLTLSRSALGDFEQSAAARGRRNLPLSSEASPAAFPFVRPLLLFVLRPQRRCVRQEVAFGPRLTGERERDGLDVGPGRLKWQTSGRERSGGGGVKVRRNAKAS